jgi:hypothetical protein
MSYAEKTTVIRTLKAPWGNVSGNTHEGLFRPENAQTNRGRRVAIPLRQRLTLGYHFCDRPWGRDEIGAALIEIRHLQYARRDADARVPRQFPTSPSRSRFRRTLLKTKTPRRTSGRGVSGAARGGQPRACERPLTAAVDAARVKSRRSLPVFQPEPDDVGLDVAFEDGKSTPDFLVCYEVELEVALEAAEKAAPPACL